jgi:hypothetical protein
MERMSLDYIWCYEDKRVTDFKSRHIFVSIDALKEGTIDLLLQKG